MKRILVMVVVTLAWVICGCNGNSRSLIYESSLKERFPAMEKEVDENIFSDSTGIPLGHNTVMVFIEWDHFIDTIFQCRKVGNIKIFTNSGEDAKFENITLTPLPCAVDWFTDDTVISERILISGSIELKKNGRKHTFEGNFCSIDGKGRLDNLLDSE